MKSGKKILYLQFTNPALYPPVQHSSYILKRNNWSIRSLGIKSSNLANFEGSSSQNISYLNAVSKHKNDSMKLLYFRYFFWCLWNLVSWRPLVVYVSDYYAAPMGYFAATLFRKKTIYHEHDYPALNKPTFFQKLLLYFRSALAKEASLCILPNRSRADQFMEETKTQSNIECVWNCPLSCEVATNKHFEHNRSLRLIYQGSLNEQRLPLTIADAINKLPRGSVGLTVIGYETIGHKGYLKRLKDRFDELNLSEALDVKDALPRRKMLEVVKQQHVGLSFVPLSSEDLNMKFMEGASNKTFDYLSQGLAVIVSKIPVWVESFEKPGYAISCDPKDVDSLAKQIKWCLENPKEIQAMGERGRQKILSEWNYETHFLSSLEHIEK